jgi:Big-like domain-containing protein
MGCSITGQTFKLFKKDSTTKIAAALSYGSSTDMATLDLSQALTSGVTYEAVVTTGAMDTAGAPVKQHRWFFTVD